MPRAVLAAATAVFAVILLVACGTTEPQGSSATADLVPTSAVAPHPITGTVTFAPVDRGVHVEGEVRGLAPGSEHGFHIHEKGDCSDHGNAAGKHFNPFGDKHAEFGAASNHAGDLPSLVADGNGVARFSFDSHSITLTKRSTGDIAGRALVVHRERDDLTSQPEGNSGPRLACGLINLSPMATNGLVGRAAARTQ